MRARRNRNGFLIVIFIGLWAFFFAGVSQTKGKHTSTPEILLAEADHCRRILNSAPEKKKYRHNWFKCIHRYEDIYGRYPKSDQAPWAIFNSARLFTDLYIYSAADRDLEKALGLYRRLVKDFSDHRLADDAQYRIGLIFYEHRKDLPQAYTEFLKVDQKFPSGDMRPKARAMLDRIAAKLPKKQKKAEIRSDQKKGGMGKSTSLLLKEADQCRKDLYSSENKKKYRHNWLKCLEKYQILFERYPKTDEAAWAIYHSAGLFRNLYAYSGESKDLDEALLLYQRVVDEYGGHGLADDAQYRIGEIYYKDKKDPEIAYVEFLKVDIKFPSGDMTPKAREMMDKLAKKGGDKDKTNDKVINAATKTNLARLKDVRHWSTPNYTRVVVDLERPVAYEHHLLKPDPDLRKPRRLYLDIKNALVTSEIDTKIPIKDGLLQGARAGQYASDTARVVLDMVSVGEYNVFHLHDPFRIVIDVRREKKAEVKDRAELPREKRTPREGIRKAETPDQSASLAKQLGLGVSRIVIDPGHGGRDPGCFTKGGIKEKNIVLNMAHILARKIKEKIGCEVLLTRTKDTSLPLEQRTAIANTKKADLFVSLHINAHKKQSIHGVETYLLNMATDERAVMVAARENATSQKNISDLQIILNDLMLNTKIHESSRLAHEVQNGIISKLGKRYKGVRNLGVKQAPFYVLIGAEMPAILIETGFLTNPSERKRLLSPTYQETIAEGISEGITAYIKGIEQVYKGG